MTRKILLCIIMVILVSQLSLAWTDQRECHTYADGNCDGVVTRNELGQYVQRWINNQATKPELENSGLAWSNPPAGAGILGLDLPSDVDPVGWLRRSYSEDLTPPSGFPWGLPWLDFIQDYQSSEPSMVEIDWLRLYCDGVIQVQQEYNDQIAEGGLFSRDPWYGDDTRLDLPIEFNTISGYLVLRPSYNNARVWHTWTLQRAMVSGGVSRCWAEARVRVTGPAFARVGLDYYGDTGNNEAGFSDWFPASPRWQIIFINKYGPW